MSETPIVVIIAILTPIISIAIAYGINKQKWRTMEETVRNCRGQHERYSGQAQEMKSSIATLTQQIKDHEDQDDDRFSRVEAALERFDRKIDELPEKIMRLIKP